jgi:hypothetical protein
MIELEASQFPLAVPLFRQTHYGVLAAGTLEGGHPGRVFVDDPGRPAIAMACTRVGYYFLAGDPLRDAGCLSCLFEEELAPDQMALTGDPQFLLFYDPPAWQPALFEALCAFQPFVIHKKRMVLDPRAAEALRGRPLEPPDGLRLVPVTQELLECHPDRLGEVLLFWDSIENFLERSLGVWVMDGENVASSCEAVFTGAGEAEISIGTAMGYRRKGLARLAGAAFIQASLARGLRPVWGCWPENAPSVALARDLGFVDDREQPVCFFELKDL